MLHITPGERSALQLLAAGTAPTQLAMHFGVDEADVDGRLSALFSKLGAATQSDAVTAALRRGLLVDAAGGPVQPAIPAAPAAPRAATN